MKESPQIHPFNYTEREGSLLVACHQTAYDRNLQPFSYGCGNIYRLSTTNSVVRRYEWEPHMDHLRTTCPNCRQLHCWFFLTEITIGKLEGYGVEVICDYRDRGDNLPLEFLNFCGYRPLRGNFHVDPIIRWWQTLLDEIPVDKDPLAEIPWLPPAQREPSRDSL